MINENEIYSCGQLDFYNALSQSEKLKLQGTSEPQQQQLQQKLQSQPNDVKQLKENEQLSQVKLETTELDIDSQLLDNFQITSAILAEAADANESAANKLPELLFKRVANPKTVTASVFKTIPAGGASKLLKSISGGKAIGAAGSVTTAAAAAAAIPSTTIGGARAPQTVTASLIQPIASIKRDLFGKLQAIDRAIIAEPSVVTASVFQPRTNAIGGAAFGITKLCNNNNSSIGAAAATSTTTTANQLASRTEAMNKPFLMFTDDMRQLTSEYSTTSAAPTAFNSLFFTLFCFFFQKPFLHRQSAHVLVCSHSMNIGRERERENARGERAKSFSANAFAPFAKCDSNRTAMCGFALDLRDLVIFT